MPRPPRDLSVLSTYGVQDPVPQLRETFKLEVSQILRAESANAPSMSKPCDEAKGSVRSSVSG